MAHSRYLTARGVRIVLNDLAAGTLGLPEQGIDAGTAERAAVALRAEGAMVVSYRTPLRSTGGSTTYLGLPPDH